MAGVALGKNEAKYIERLINYREQVVTDHADSPQEGFAYFDSEEYRQNYGGKRLGLSNKFKAVGLRNMPRMVRIMGKHIVKISKGRQECFSDLEQYLAELEQKGCLTAAASPLLQSYPNPGLWDSLCTYAWQNWRVKIGFTELPEQFVFKGKAVLFKHALVCIQEMNKAEIDHAPKLQAGSEVLKIYKELGLAVNDIARWLREKHSVRCQSNHPLGGLVNTTPLASKAGLGWQGHNGLLITPWYGQRQRIAPIFLEEKIFEYTDNYDHVWIEKFCKNCRRCERACPVKAIYSEKKVSADNIPGIGQTRTCIDRTKCFPQFNATLGCSICIKVCPFSGKEGSYRRLKSVYDKKNGKR